MVYVPLPDYSSRIILWKELIAQDGGKLKSSTDISNLAKVSEGYSAGSVSQYFYLLLFIYHLLFII